MRFAAVVRATQPVRMLPPPTVPRGPVPGQVAALTQPPTPQPQDVPPDLDQRVRLAGEW